MMLDTGGQERHASGNILSVERLKYISRHVKNFVTTDTNGQTLGTNGLKNTLSDVSRAAELSTLTATHRVAAWNTLCALIDQCIASEIEPVKAIIWEGGVWHSALELYLSQSHNARPKSSKQLLVSLATALRKIDNTSHIRDTISKRCLGILTVQNDLSQAKAGVMVLLHFLSKNILFLDDVTQVVKDLDTGPTHRTDQDAIKYLLFLLFTWVGKAEFGSAIGQLVSVVLDKCKYAPKDEDETNGFLTVPSQHQVMWSSPLDDALLSGSVGVGGLRIHIFPTLFKSSFTNYISFLHGHGFENLMVGSTAASENRMEPGAIHHEVICAALQVGKELGIVGEAEGSEISRTASIIFIPVDYFDRLLSQSSHSARLAGLSLLITSHSVTRPFSLRILASLRRFLCNFFANTDANFRSEVVSLMQKLMERLRAITAMLARQAKVDASIAESLEEHRTFLVWFLRFLTWELRPSASYQRHISALKTLLAVARSGLDDEVSMADLSKSATAETKWPFHIKVVDDALVELLLNLLMDPFDDVRQTSASILSLYTSSRQELRDQIRQKLERTTGEARKLMLSTCRADHADGVAQFYSLTYKYSAENSDTFSPFGSSRQKLVEMVVNNVERMILVAKDDLATAAKSHPMHGEITGLRNMLVQIPSLELEDSLWSRLEACLHTLWDLVKPILCNDAPEGYQLDETEVAPDYSTKDTLSYCWRALKESSLLLGALVMIKTIRRDTLVSLSALCFTQLAELRHRGAFSTVAQTWTVCCICCRDVHSQDDQSHLQLWYANTLRILKNKVTINTRRSAGLPALLCGLLIADKSGCLVAQAFDDLDTIARQPTDSKTDQESSLPQVHALNCVKDILKNTRLGEYCEYYLPQALRLAADSLQSEAWAIRNCGLMLFRALIDRLLGTSEAHFDDDFPPQQILSAKEHSELLGVTLKLFSIRQDGFDPSKSGRNEGVFLALQLLQRMQIPEQEKLEARDAVFALTECPSWHVRNKAARTFAALYSREESPTEIRRHFDASIPHSNAQHGALLCSRYLVANIRSSPVATASATSQANESNTYESTLKLARVCFEIVSSAKKWYHTASCPVIQSAYIDVLTDCFSLVYSISYKAGEHATAQTQEAIHLYDKIHALDIKAELSRAIELGPTGGGATSILRYSLARSLAYEVAYRAVAENDTKAMVTLITLLGWADADACAAFFAVFKDLEPVIFSPSNCVDAVLLPAAHYILSNDFDMRLQCEIQQTLLAVIDQSIASNPRPSFSPALAETCAAMCTPLRAQTSQRYADQFLQLQGLAIDHQVENLHYDKHQGTVQIAVWVAACSSAVKGQGLYSVEAAALAMHRIRNLWRLISSETVHSTQFYALCLSTYDLLNDDDEDIRSLAAKIVCQILDVAGKHLFPNGLEPLVASQKLMNFMIQRWRSDIHFVEEVFYRAFSITTGSQGQSMIDHLEGSRTTDTALFAEEKQNLYIDEAREVRVWSQIVPMLCSATIPAALVKKLSSLVCAGWEAMTGEAESSLVGAVLGWNIQEEVFTAGLRVIYGTEILLGLVERGVKLPRPPSHLRLMAGRCMTAGANRGLHVLWIREMQRLLETSVGCKLRAVHGFVESLPLGGLTTLQM